MQRDSNLSKYRDELRKKEYQARLDAEVTQDLIKQGYIMPDGTLTKSGRMRAYAIIEGVLDDDGSEPLSKMNGRGASNLENSELPLSRYPYSEQGLAASNPHFNQNLQTALDIVTAARSAGNLADPRPGDDFTLPPPPPYNVQLSSGFGEAMNAIHAGRQNGPKIFGHQHSVGDLLRAGEQTASKAAKVSKLEGLEPLAKARRLDADPRLIGWIEENVQRAVKKNARTGK